MTERWTTRASEAVIDRLQQAGYEAVYVGGAVRDVLLGHRPHDFDIATSARPEQIEALFSKTFDVGKEHGTIVVICQGESFEVTTFRSESTYRDHRRPDEVQFVTSLREDLERRDFTMNALAYDGERYIDLFEGRADIEARLIRAVGEAEQRFEEDALRMLRAIRFVSTLRFDIEKETFAAIQRCASSIPYVAKERMKQEFDKLFEGHDVRRAIDALYDSGLSFHVPLFQDGRYRAYREEAIQSAVDGWATVAYELGVEAHDVARAYKCSKKERFAMEARLRLLRDERPWSAWHYYTYDLDTLHFVNVYKAYDRSREQLLAAQDALPIRSKRDLVVDGHTLLHRHPTLRGAEIGNVLHELERLVVTETLQNEKEEIIEWVDQYVNERIRVETIIEGER